MASQRYFLGGRYESLTAAQIVRRIVALDPAKALGIHLRTPNSGGLTASAVDRNGKEVGVVVIKPYEDECPEVLVIDASGQQILTRSAYALSADFEDQVLIFVGH